MFDNFAVFIPLVLYLLISFLQILNARFILVKLGRYTGLLVYNQSVHAIQTSTSQEPPRAVSEVPRYHIEATHGESG
jgi:hypothetical protein